MKTLYAWDCTCDKVCTVDEWFIAPFINSNAADPTPEQSNSKEKSLFSTFLDKINDGYDIFKTNYEKFGKLLGVENTIGDLLVRARGGVLKYYMDAIIYKNQSDPLKLFCDTTRHFGYCKCFLKEVPKEPEKQSWFWR